MSDSDGGQGSKKSVDGGTLAAPQAVWSSGVAFYPPSRRHWRIGGGTRRRQPHAAEFSEKELVVDIVTGLIAAAEAPPPKRSAGGCSCAACLA